MKIKKILSVLFSVLLLTVLFTSCAESSSKVNKPTLEEGTMAVHFFDVGQGDSEFIEFPNGTTMLIDGGEIEMGERVISNIKALGYNSITYVVATHPHSDHIGGLITVLNTFDVETVYMPNVTTNTSIFEKLLYVLENKDCKVVEAKSGVNVIDEENLFAEFVAPVSKKYKNLNDYSAVLKVKYGKTSFLFTGDAEKTSENEITADIRADVLKVGHHGSNSSSTKKFVERVNPKYAIFEVGDNNSYNHPNDDIVKRYEEFGAEIFRTDENGNITIKSNGKDLAVITNDTFSNSNVSNNSNAEETKENINSNSADKNTNNNQNNNSKEDSVNSSKKDEISNDDSSKENSSSSSNYKWVLNTKSKKIHTPQCNSVSKISSSNSKTSNKTISELQKEGYSCCKVCNPSD